MKIQIKVFNFLVKIVGAFPVNRLYLSSAKYFVFVFVPNVFKKEKKP